MLTDIGPNDNHHGSKIEAGHYLNDVTGPPRRIGVTFAPPRRQGPFIVPKLTLPVYGTNPPKT